MDNNDFFLHRHVVMAYCMSLSQDISAVTPTTYQHRSMPPHCTSAVVVSSTPSRLTMSVVMVSMSW